MVNMDKLRGKLVEKKLTIEDFAKKMNFSTATAYRKISSDGESFTIGEANKIVALLNLSPNEAMSIFFTSEVA